MCDGWQSRRSRSRYNWSIFKKFPGHKPLIKDLERLFIFNASGMSGRHSHMFSLRWNFSNPSKSTRTSSGFSSKLFQTSSSMCCLGKYSDRIKSSLRLRLLAVLKLPNFTKKAAPKWILVSDVALKTLSNAQPLRSLIQHNVFPITGSTDG